MHLRVILLAALLTVPAYAQRAPDEKPVIERIKPEIDTPTPEKTGPEKLVPEKVPTEKAPTVYPDRWKQNTLNTYYNGGQATQTSGDPSKAKPK